jgi:HSP20 family protein
MLLRTDPFQLFDRLAREVFPFSFTQPLGITSGWMPMDAVRRDGYIELAFDLPGIDPSSVDLTVERNLLTVKAERRYQPADGDQVLISERPQGSFTRQVALSEAVDLDKIEARYENGVLLVTVPVSEAAKPHRIQIKAGDATKAIPAGEPVSEPLTKQVEQPVAA